MGFVTATGDLPWGSTPRPETPTCILHQFDFISTLFN